MNEGIRKFRKLLLTDEGFQQKLKAAAEAYTGEKTEEAIFNEVLAPLAAEYGISSSYDEFHSFMTSDQEMDSEELAQIAGGKSAGFGGSTCLILGVGIGGGGGDGAGGACVMLGAGWGETKCKGSGEATWNP